jgi:protocatechuate 3,4-dioxygenase alpha subunit
LIEIWQADNSHYGWSHTDESGSFRFEINKPAPVPGPDGRDQAPHVLVSVMARGVLTRYVTRAYFDDEDANRSDAILNLVPAGRRKTLIARMTAPGWYHFDIRIQGEDETVFFDV